MPRSGRLALAFAVALGVACALYLVLVGSPSIDDPLDALDRSSEGPSRAARLRGHPRALDEVRAVALGDGVVAGLVLDEAGRPAAGVAIRTRREWEPYRRNVLALPPPGESRGEPPFDGAAVSDPDGRFLIEGLEAGTRTSVWALPAPPYGAARALATPRADRAVHVILHLVRGTPLCGRVVDVDGRGIPAWIDGQFPFRNRHRASGAGAWCVRGLATDADGRFVIDIVPEGIVWLSAFAPGVGARSFFPVRAPARGEVLIRLGEVPGAGLHGSVRDVAEKPVEGAQVFARIQGRPLGFGFQETSGLVAWSGRDGRYRIENLPSGTIQEIRVAAEGFLEERYLGSGIPLPAGEAVPFDIVLVRGCALEGRVVDDAERPLEGARVWAADLRPHGSPPRSESGARIHTDATGHYRIEGVHAGRRSMFANLQGWKQDGHVLVDARERTVVAVPDVVLVPEAPSESAAGETTPSAGPTGAIEGVLRTPDGNPVPGLEIEAVSPAGRRVVIAGPCGVFRLPALEPGTWRLKAQEEGKEAWGDEVEVEVEEGRVTSGVQVLTPVQRFITGVVVDARGDPGVGISVSAHRPVRDWYDNTVAHTWSDLDGAFTLTLYEEGEWVLSVGHRQCEGTYGAGPRVLRFVHRPYETRSVVIVVLDPEGAPLLHATVKVRWAPKGSRGSVTSTRPGGGRYYAEIPPTIEEVDVIVEGAVDAARRPLDVAPYEQKGILLSDDPIEVRLERSRSLVVAVTDPAGRPVEGALVRVRPTQTSAERTSYWQTGAPDIHRTDARGCVTAVGLSPGARLVAIVVTDGPHANPPPVLVGPDTNRIDVRLLPSTTVEGRVVDESGRALAGVTVLARLDGTSQKTWRPTRVTVPAPPHQGWYVKTDQEGRFVVDRVPEGTTLHVSTGGRQEHMRVAASGVAAGAKDLLLTPHLGARIRGRCTGVGPWLEEGRVDVELHEATDTRSPPASQVTRRSLRDDGAFDLGPVPAGRYRLIVKVGWSTLVGDTVVDAPTEGLEVRLRKPYRLEVRVEGKDVEGFVVATLDREGEGPSSTIDASGVTRFTFLDDEPRRVFVWRDGDERFGLVNEARPSAGPVRVTLRPGLSIAGRIEGAPSDQVSKFYVRVSGDVTGRAVKVAADGTFRVVGLPPGAYEVKVLVRRSTGGHVEPLEDVAAGREDLVLRFEPR